MGVEYLVMNSKTFLRSLWAMILLMFSLSCATKFRHPLNRMVTPETVGGAMNSELMIYQLGQGDGKVDITKPEPYPLRFSETTSLGYYGALSLLDSLDITWQHTASAPSMLGFKWQLLGGSLQQAGTGQSLALTTAFGGNEHEVDGRTRLNFEVAATDFALIHGFWLTPNWQIYESLGYSNFNFDGTLSGTSSGNFKDSGTVLMGSVGTAFVMKPFKLQVEGSYTKADWEGQGEVDSFSFAAGLGFIF